MHWTQLAAKRFVEESNRIEGIMVVTDREVAAFEDFLNLDRPRVSDLEALVSVFQPGAVLRDKGGVNVRVGDHIAPPGGPEIRANLGALLVGAAVLDCAPFHTHLLYEHLHPFTDCNGRSGRALWAWQMVRGGYGLEHGFLHIFYYQSLEAWGKENEQ